ncbi:MAG: RecX family transcriptional regulator [Gemmatimonadales bacterium]|nr:RecX family transcriptional regulator [Gemmatimonadales bacterium]
MIDAGQHRAGRITALIPESRGQGSVRVEVDGQRFASVSPDAVRAHGLHVGRELDQALRGRLEAEAEVEAAYRTALRSIERRSFARADLGRRLLRKGHARQPVEAALGRAAEQGLLDDAAFAANYVETRSARGRGPLRLARDLMAMGVERSVVDRAVAAHARASEGGSEMPVALATKRAAQLRDLPRPVRRRRVLAYLARRGFSGREVSEMVGKLLA